MKLKIIKFNDFCIVANYIQSFESIFSTTSCLLILAVTFYKNKMTIPTMESERFAATNKRKH